MTISPASGSVLDYSNVKTKDNLKCVKVKDGPTSKLNKEISSNNKSFKVEKIYAVNIPEKAEARALSSLMMSCIR